MAPSKQSEPALTAAAGDSRIGDQYFSLLYDELHRLASRELRKHGAAVWSPTTLLHETFVNVSIRKSALLADRRRFMTYASRAMRGLVIDHIRRDSAQKRGRGFEIISLAEVMEPGTQSDIGVEQLRDALDALAIIDPRLAECVDLKFFCGYSFCDIAELWRMSERTVLRDWDRARVLLSRLIREASFDSRQPSPACAE